MRITFKPALLNWIEICLAAVILLLVYLNGLTAVTFTPDESAWVHTSYYWEAFSGLDLRSEVWNEQYWTLTQPPLTRYIIGISRRWLGFSADQLNPPWNFYVDWDANVRQGTIPGEHLLWAARLPMALLSVLCGVLLFVLVRAGAGRLPAWIWILFFAVNPFFLLNLRRAMSETPMLAPLVLALVLGWQLLESGSGEHGERKALTWVALMGLSIGLSGAAKINGLLALFPGILLCLLLVFATLWLPRPQRAAVAIRSTALLVFLSLSVFVLLNPFLYPNPLIRLVQMIRFRQHEMDVQYAQFPEAQIGDLMARLRIVLQRLFNDFAPFHFPFSEWLFILLFLIGLAFLLLGLWRWLKGQPGQTAAAALLILLLPLAGAMLLTPLDWDRYYLLPVLLVNIGVSVGLGKFVLYGPALFKKMRCKPDLVPAAAPVEKPE